jgi:hypothetical protein
MKFIGLIAMCAALPMYDGLLVRPIKKITSIVANTETEKAIQKVSSNAGQAHHSSPQSAINNLKDNFLAAFSTDPGPLVSNSAQLPDQVIASPSTIHGRFQDNPLRLDLPYHFSAKERSSPLPFEVEETNPDVIQKSVTEVRELFKNDDIDHLASISNIVSVDNLKDLAALNHDLKPLDYPTRNLLMPPKPILPHNSVDLDPSQAIIPNSRKVSIDYPTDLVPNSPSKRQRTASIHEQELQFKRKESF